MSFKDVNLSFTTVTAGADVPFAPTLAQDNLCPNTIPLDPLTLPSGSGGGSTPGYGGVANTNAGRDLGIGGEMWVEVIVTTAVAQSANSATFKLVTDNTATITTVNVLLQSPAFTAAQLALPTANGTTGYWRAQLPASGSYLQWLGLNVAITTTAWTAGAIVAGLVENIQQSDLYQGGFAVA